MATLRLPPNKRVFLPSKAMVNIVYYHNLSRQDRRMALLMNPKRYPVVNGKVKAR